MADRTEPEFPRIASIYGAQLGPDATDVELRLLARYDLLIGGLQAPADTAGRQKLNDNIKRLRELKPEIIVLDFSTSAPYWGVGEGEPPESAFLHTTSGERISGWPGTEMLNLSRAEAIELHVNRVAERYRSLEVDGVFLDCMGGGFDWWAVEIETHRPVAIDADGDGREDHRDDLNGLWVQGKSEMLARLRESLGDDVVTMINGQSGAGYARPHVNGNYYEDYVDYVISNHMTWSRVISEYLADCSYPHAPNCTTINASSAIWPEYNARSRLPPDECEELLRRGHGELARMRFGLATALMGDGYYGYDMNTRWRGQHWWYAEFGAPLGRALGCGTQQENGTWRRDFEGGSVIANPQPRRVEVEFAEKRRDFTTGWTGRSFVIPAYDGRILIPVG